MGPILFFIFFPMGSYNYYKEILKKKTEWKTLFYLKKNIMSPQAWMMSSQGISKMVENAF